MGKEKGARTIEDKKKEEPIQKLEREFRAFQVEWKKFLTNALPHLTKDVGSLTKDVGDINMRVGTLIEQNVKEHAELYGCMEIMLKNEGEMKQTSDTLLEATTRIVGLLNRGR